MRCGLATREFLLWRPIEAALKQLGGRRRSPNRVDEQRGDGRTSQRNAAAQRFRLGCGIAPDASRHHQGWRDAHDQAENRAEWTAMPQTDHGSCYEYRANPDLRDSSPAAAKSLPVMARSAFPTAKYLVPAGSRRAGRELLRARRRPSASARSANSDLRSPRR